MNKLFSGLNTGQWRIKTQRRFRGSEDGGARHGNVLVFGWPGVYGVVRQLVLCQNTVNVMKKNGIHGFYSLLWRINSNIRRSSDFTNVMCPLQTRSVVLWYLIVRLGCWFFFSKKENVIERVRKGGGDLNAR